MRVISVGGMEMIKKFEGCRLQAYKAHKSEKFYTIGYGHYSANVKPDQVITPIEAHQLLRTDLKRAESAVNKWDHIYHWSQNEFDALVSFAFNVGSIDQLTDAGRRTKAVIADKMLLYNKCGKTVLAGLTKRRQAERALYVQK